MDWSQAAQRAERLAQLLEQPQPGLMTWLLMVGAAWRELGDALHWPSLPTEAEIQALEQQWQREAEQEQG